MERHKARTDHENCEGRRECPHAVWDGNKALLIENYILLSTLERR